jgi:hypothetical protein
MEQKFMGITKSSLLGMRYAAANGAEFKNTLTVARLGVFMKKHEAEKILKTWGGGGVIQPKHRHI